MSALDVFVGVVVWVVIATTVGLLVLRGIQLWRMRP